MDEFIIVEGCSSGDKGDAYWSKQTNTEKHTDKHRELNRQTQRSRQTNTEN